MIDRLVEELIWLGFPERVAQVYVALVRRGQGSAPELAKELSIPRGAVHDAGIALIHHGFAKKMITHGVVTFVPEPPLVIRKSLEEKLRESESKVERFDVLLPNLRALSAIAGGTQPAVRFVDGIDGLKIFQKEFAALPGDIIQMFDYDTFCSLGIDKEKAEHRSELVDQNKKVRSIVMTNGKVPDRLIDGYDVRIVPKDCVAAPGEMSVCDDRVLLLSYANGVTAVEVRSKVIADVCRATLELAWSAAVRIDQTVSS